MALEDIRKESVIKAIKKFDKIGRDKMVVRYGGGPSKSLYIDFEGKRYDQKLICRAAHRIQEFELPDDVKARDTQRKLKKLGFNVVGYND